MKNIAIAIPFRYHTGTLNCSPNRFINDNDIEVHLARQKKPLKKSGVHWQFEAGITLLLLRDML
jgi:hypothetical protein